MSKKLVLSMIALVSLLLSSCGLLAGEDPQIANVVATADALDSITITWDDLDEAATYTVRAATSVNGSYTSISSDISSNSFVFDADNSRLTPEPGTTYYFMVRYTMSGKSSWAADAETCVTDSAVFPELSPGLKMIEADISSDMTINSATSVTVSVTYKGDATQIDSLKLYYKYSYEAASAEMKEWPFPWTDTSDGAEISFTMSTIKDGYHRDGQKVSYKAVAFDSNGNEINSLSTTETIRLFDKVHNVKLSRDGDVLTVAFAGSSIANKYKIRVFNDNDNNIHEYLESGPYLLEATMDDLGNPYTEYKYIYKCTFTGMNAVSSGNYDVYIWSGTSTEYHSSFGYSTISF